MSAPTTGSTTPPSSDHANSPLDLAFRVLSRHLPHLTRIITHSSIAALYYGIHFPDDTFNWQERGEKGSMFLVASQAPGQASEDYHLFILSRWGVTNWVFTLTSTTGIETRVGDIHLVLPLTCGHTDWNTDGLGLAGPIVCYGVHIYSPSGTSTEGDGERMIRAVLECADIKEKEAMARGLPVGEPRAAPERPELRGVSILDQVFQSLGGQQPSQSTPPPQQQQQQQYQQQQQHQQHQQYQQGQQFNIMQPQPQHGNLMTVLFPNQPPQF